MFANCLSLRSLPNISLWNTKNITNMEYLFYNCSSLLIFPKIYNWKTNNLENMNNIFYGCKSLSLPDISKWDVSKVKNFQVIFASDSSNYESLQKDCEIISSNNSYISKKDNKNNNTINIYSYKNFDLDFYILDCSEKYYDDFYNK